MGLRTNDLVLGSPCSPVFRLHVYSVIFRASYVDYSTVLFLVS